VNDRPRIDLDLSELVICQTIAAMRHQTNRSSNVKDRQRGNQDKIAIDVDGMIGEVAAAKMLNLCPDFTVGQRSGGHDLIGRTGKTIDVKATRRSDGQLLGEIKKKDACCDVYMLMIVDDHGAVFAGWAWGHELFDEANLVDLGHGQTYALPQSRLRQKMA
jgi:hypothetical protein